MSKLKVILIGGSSNVGKSTLAKALADKLGGQVISTDSLARHPGRSWTTKTKTEVPQHVVEHYLSLSVDELIEGVLRHYKGMQPNIHSLIASHAMDNSTAPLIMEGSGLWPEFISTLKIDNTAAIWLTASNNLFEKRIRNTSQIDEAVGPQRIIIEKFLGRTLTYNERMMESINRIGLVSIDVESTSSLDELCDKCLELSEKQLSARKSAFHN